MKKTISLSTVVWGNWHTEVFLRFCLVSLLSKNNLPYLSKQFNIKYTIATCYSNKKKFESSLSYIDIQYYCVFDILYFDDSLIPFKENINEDAYVYAVKCTKFLVKQQNKVIEKSFQDSIGIINIYPDCIYSSQTFKTISDKINNESSLVYMPGFRVNYEKFINTDFGCHFLETHERDEQFITNSLDCLHSYHQSQFWNNNLISKYPSALFWDNPAFVLNRSFHERIPIFVSSKYSDIPIVNGIDADFDNELYKTAEANGGKVAYLTSSRQSFVSSLAKDDYELLDRWAIQGNLDNKLIANQGKLDVTINSLILILRWYSYYISCFKIFKDAVQLFSSSHIYIIYKRTYTPRTIYIYIFLNTIFYKITKFIFSLYSFGLKYIYQNLIFIFSKIRQLTLLLFYFVRRFFYPVKLVIYRVLHSFRLVISWLFGTNK